MLSYYLLFYSTFLVLRTTFSFKSLSRSIGPFAGQYLSGKSMNPTDHRDPSLINQFTCGTALNMASMYGNVIGGDLTKTTIEAPTLNSRKITASIVVNSPISDVWSIITDYNQLAVHVPNLVKSYVIPRVNINSEDFSYASSVLANTKNNIKVSPVVRIFQEGAQKIVGFDFRASLTMDMTEEIENEGRAMAEKKTLYFKLAESSMFSSFDGNWSIRYHSRARQYDTVSKAFVFRYKTMLTYCVTVKPKGPVPVIALEWRIKEDVPINLMAMKVAAEKVTSRGIPQFSPSEVTDFRAEWGADETLGMYLGGSNDSVKTESPASSWMPRIN